MTDVAKFNIAISAILDVPETDEHPFLTIAQFVLTDDRPNENGQAVEYAEFENIKRTAIGMPVKMNFNGIDLADHAGSVPIGVIRNIIEKELPNGTHQLIAEASLWKEEYPEEIEFLKERFANNDAPGISYELGYADSETKGGVQWIKRVITLAATFVKHPAYGKRTRLIALASNATVDDLVAEVIEVANTKEFALTDVVSGIQVVATPVVSGQSSDEGGNQMEEELQETKALAASLTQQIEDLQKQLTDKDLEITKANETITSLQTAAVIDSRTRRFVEAGFNLEADAEKADAKKALWASLSDEMFDVYLGDLVEAKASAAPAAPAPTLSPALAAIAQASLNGSMPRLEAQEMDYSNLKTAMRGLARPNSIE